MKKIWSLIVLMLLLSGCSGSEGGSTIYTGTVEATQYDISADVSGKIIEIFVDEGSIVEKGEAVAKLDDTQLSYGVLQQEAGYYSTQEQLKDILKGNRKEEIEIAELELKKGQIALATAKERFNHIQELYLNTKELFEEGAVNEQKLKDSKLQLDQAQADMENSERNIDLLTSKLSLLKSGATQEQVKSNEYNVEQQKYQYEQAKIQMEKTNVTTPENGIVLYKYYNEGEFLPVGAPIVTITNLEELWIKIYVPEKEIHLVNVGDEVPILSDLVSQKITGEVVFISPQSEFTPSNVTTKEDRHNRVHEIKINVVEGKEYINPGMILDVNLTEENKTR